MNRFRHIPLLLAVAAIAVGAAPASAQDAAFKLVVHPDNPTSALPSSEVAKLFLKQVTRWSHGGAVKPVDQTDGSDTRARFSDQVLNRSVAAVESYWQQQIYSGRAVPPVKVATDEDVVAYVKANPTAIGYVSVSAATSGVKSIAVR